MSHLKIVDVTFDAELPVFLSRTNKIVRVPEFGSTRSHHFVREKHPEWNVDILETHPVVGRTLSLWC